LCVVRCAPAMWPGGRGQGSTAAGHPPDICSAARGGPVDIDMRMCDLGLGASSGHVHTYASTP
jgi:hypothetical protein